MNSQEPYFAMFSSQEGPIFLSSSIFNGSSVTYWTMFFEISKLQVLQGLYYIYFFINSDFTLPNISL